MAYTIDWYIKDEIVYIYYAGVSTADELRDSLLEAMAYIDSSPRPLVHVITDVGDVTQPVSIKESLEIVREIGSHDRMGWQITLREPSVMIKMGIAFGTTIFKIRTRTFDGIDAAVEFLKTQDETIHWENVNLSLTIQ